MITYATKKSIVLFVAVMVAAVEATAFAVRAEDVAAATPEAPIDPARIQAAVSGGLKWLAERQIKDGPEAGSWECRQYPTAVASFAGLAFLANGHLPGKGDYSNVVVRAMNYVKASMTKDGYLGTQGNSMYVHAICTLFGLSCLGMAPEFKEDQELAEWCRKSVKLIVEAQKVPKRNGEQGGWRYSPSTTESDLSVTSWQMLTLHSAKQCGFDVDPICLQDAMRYINSAWMDSGNGVGGFVYRLGVSKEPESGVSGAAVFIKILMESEPDAALSKTCEYLQQFPPAWGGPQYNGYFFFVSFYLAQGMLQQGGEAWSTYCSALQKILLEHQEGDGHWQFPPDNRASENEDTLGYSYSTALSVLMLSLEKQYLPMYQRQMPLY
jgi:hypothetical protein